MFREILVHSFDFIILSLRQKVSHGLQTPDDKRNAASNIKLGSGSPSYFVLCILRKTCPYSIVRSVGGHQCRRSSTALFDLCFIFSECECPIYLRAYTQPMARNLHPKKHFPHSLPGVSRIKTGSTAYNT